MLVFKAVCRVRPGLVDDENVRPRNEVRVLNRYSLTTAYAWYLPLIDETPRDPHVLQGIPLNRRELPVKGRLYRRVHPSQGFCSFWPVVGEVDHSFQQRWRSGYKRKGGSDIKAQKTIIIAVDEHQIEVRGKLGGKGSQSIEREVELYIYIFLSHTHLPILQQNARIDRLLVDWVQHVDKVHVGEQLGCPLVDGHIDGSIIDTGLDPLDFRRVVGLLPPYREDDVESGVMSDEGQNWFTHPNIGVAGLLNGRSQFSVK